MVVEGAMMIKKIGKMKIPETCGKKNLIEIRKRLSGWQLKSFLDSYNHKLKNGISLYKKENIKGK